MNKEASETTNRMRVVTISREYGSGGGEIAARLARSLGWLLIDHAIVERVASELGTSLEVAEAYDEAIGGIISQLLEATRNLYPAYTPDLPPEAFLSAEDYCRTVDKIVMAAAARGHVVIVGRASQVILADRRDVLHVRIIAPLEQRVAYVMQREGLARHAAEARIHHKDHERARYLEREYHYKPDEAQLYDLVLNTSLLDLENAVDIICFTLQQKAKGLAKTTGELGPATGLSRYPAPPADFPSLAR